MIDSLTTWIKGIVFVVLFASFVELLLPSNNMQRFVRVILGLFILLSILQPIISMMENRWIDDLQPALATRSVIQPNEADILKATNHVIDKREQLARDIYIKDLAKQIRATVLAIDGVADAKVTIDLDSTADQGSKDIGRIKNVIVYIEPGITANERKIAKITVGSTSSSASSENIAQLSDMVINKIKRTVAELYQLKTNQIEVKRLH